MKTLTTIDLANLSHVTGGAGEMDGPSLGAAPMMGGVGSPVSGLMTQGTGNMGFGATKSFGSIGGFNSPTTGANGPLGGFGSGGGGGGSKANLFGNQRDQLLY